MPCWIACGIPGCGGNPSGGVRADSARSALTIANTAVGEVGLFCGIVMLRVQAAYSGLALMPDGSQLPDTVYRISGVKPPGFSHGDETPYGLFVAETCPFYRYCMRV